MTTLGEGRERERGKEDTSVNWDTMHDNKRFLLRYVYIREVYRLW